MQGKRIGNKPESLEIPVINGETSEVEPGTPVCFKFDATDDGIEVVLPATAGAAKADTLLAGIVVEKNLPITLPKTGLAQVYGYCRVTKIVRQTRAATTDSFASYVAVAIGDRFVVNTIANAMSRSDAGVAGIAPGRVIAAETLASGASSASSTSITVTAITGTMKTFLRLC